MRNIRFALINDIITVPKLPFCHHHICVIRINESINQLIPFEFERYAIKLLLQ